MNEDRVALGGADVLTSVLLRTDPTGDKVQPCNGKPEPHRHSRSVPTHSK
jgi:hypothetical protein